MSTLTVGAGKQFSTLASAIAASHDGDVLQVQAGTYTNDFAEITHKITIEGVGGMAKLVATDLIPNGKAILITDTDVTLDHLEFSGAAVGSGNGAGIRYQGGKLTVTNSYFHDNQNGILGAPDSNGVINIDHSEFNHNGSGTGSTHNMYIGLINQFTLTNSYTHDAVVGHEIKSRAANNTITGNRILDNSGNASYEIDLPSGGNANISNNVIQQSSASGNPTIIAYGEEGILNPGTSVSVTNNTIVNDKGNRGAALWNAGSTTATLANNKLYGWGGNAITTGPVAQTGSIPLASRPPLDTSPINFGATPTPPPPTPDPTPVPTPGSGLVINVSEDAYLGNALFTISVDGKQVGGTYTATASHAAGQSQAFTVGTALAAGAHTVGVTFLNDAWGGSSTTDRNLYVDGATYDGQAISGAKAVLQKPGTDTFTFTASAPSTPPVTTPITSKLVLNVSEDAYLGDAKFAVSVDGKAMGTYTATASHAAGQSQAVTITGIAESFTPHDIAVTFLNDAWGGTASTDRNLYVNSMQFDNQNVPGGSAAFLKPVTDHFTAVAPANWVG